MNARYRRLIVNADDFGRSAKINEAVIRAHEDGILTTASLMVTGEAFAEAVALAKAHPRLGVGLHLTLICGRSALAPHLIPGLVAPNGEFRDTPASTGFRYFSRPELRAQLAAEIAAQVAKFHATGLMLDHVNGHLHFHLHPTVFGILMGNVVNWNIRRLRLTRDPLGPNWRLAKGRWAYRLSHALVFGLLSAWARPALDRHRIKYTDAVFGLLQNGLVDEQFILGLVPNLQPGTVELYSHPSMHTFKNEFDALVSSRVKEALTSNHVELIRYQDLE